VRTKETAIAKLTLVGSQTFHGYVGRSYKLSIGDLNGVVHAFVTRKRFYAIVSLNTKKDDALEEKFLSSFALPDRQPDAPKNNASAANEGGQQNEQTIDSQPPSGDQKQAKPEGETARSEEAPNPDPNAKDPNNNSGNQPPTQAQPNTKKGPISGGMLNSKAIYLPMPEVPAGEASGVVLVAIVVDEQGMVIEARAVSGPPHLHNPAVAAARLARFSPTLLMGEPVRVSGTLSYNFVRSN
jgi:outer membrane biosynthesis protein TonB